MRRGEALCPAGNRSLAVGTRAGQHGPGLDAAEFAQEANEDTVSVVQIVDEQGLAHLSEIGAVGCVHVAFIGPSDVSQTGCPLPGSCPASQGMAPAPARHALASEAGPVAPQARLADAPLAAARLLTQPAGAVLRSGLAGEAYNLGGGNQVSARAIAALVLDRLDKPSSLVQFVADRPGHDYRYSVDTSKASSLGWATPWTFEDGLSARVRWYEANRDWWKGLNAGGSNRAPA